MNIHVQLIPVCCHQPLHKSTILCTVIATDKTIVCVPGGRGGPGGCGGRGGLLGGLGGLGGLPPTLVELTPI